MLADYPVDEDRRRQARGFDVGPLGEYLLGREAAHSERRIVHASGDRTGAEVVRAFQEAMQARDWARARSLLPRSALPSR